MEEAKESQNLWPSGLWTDFWTVPNRLYLTFRNHMDIDLIFKKGKMSGRGNNIVGKFTIGSSYKSDDMKCSFIKDYLRHVIDYEGYRDGKGYMESGQY